MERLVIDADKKSFGINLKELLKYKDLFVVLAYRDFKVRYAQTILGFAWGVLQPAATLLIFTLVFGTIVNVKTGGIPYPLFALAGMIGWTYFAFVLSQAGDSIIGAQAMVKKIYFPRLIIPLSKALVGLVDFLIAFVILLLFMLYYGSEIHPSIVYLPLAILFTMIASLGAGIWLSALTIRYRDFKHVIPFVTQLGMYLTPIAYPSSMIPEKYLGFIYLNPMAGIIDLYKYAILNIPPATYAWESFLIALLLFVSSLFYFRKVESIMADVV